MLIAILLGLALLAFVVSNFLPKELLYEGTKYKFREPRNFEVIACFDCGYVGNRANEIQDSTLSGQPFIDLACPECGESCGPYFEVIEIIGPDTGHRKEKHEDRRRWQRVFRARCSRRLVLRGSMFCRSIMYPLTFAPSTQEKLNQLQTQVADTRVANQLILTNEAQATANAKLTRDTSTQSLQQQCLTIMAEIVKQGHVPPINMNCGLGSSSGTGLIVNSSPAPSVTVKR